MTTTATAFMPPKPAAPAGDNSADVQDTQLIARCCRWLEAEQPPGLQQLAERAGISPWRLHRIFKAATGLTPKAYLVRLRLHRVREALLRAQAGSTTIAIEALNWGFWHFGEFSQSYKSCFGELPSQTLRCKPSTGPRP